jgi:integrase/recombinase XerC
VTDGTDIIEALLATRRAHATRAAYRSDLGDLARFLHGSESRTTIDHFVRQPQEHIVDSIESYQRSLIDRGVSAATINRRMAAVRALLSFAATHGVAETDGRSIIRNRRPPVVSAVTGLPATRVRLLLSLQDRKLVGGLRDAILIRLLCENGLRTQEVCGTTVRDFSAAAGTLVLRRGESHSRTVTLSNRCVHSIAEYLRLAGHAGMADAPIFQNLDHRPGYRGSALTGKGLRYVLENYGRQLGEDLTPRMLRRTSIGLGCLVSHKDAAAVQEALDASSDGCANGMAAGILRQPDLTQGISDLLSAPHHLREEADRLRAYSAKLRQHSEATTRRSDWLLKKCRNLQERLEEQAARWTAFEQERRRAKESGDVGR